MPNSQASVDREAIEQLIASFSRNLPEKYNFNFEHNLDYVSEVANAVLLARIEKYIKLTLDGFRDSKLLEFINTIERLRLEKRIRDKNGECSQNKIDGELQTKDREYTQVSDNESKEAKKSEVCEEGAAGESGLGEDSPRGDIRKSNRKRIRSRHVI